MISSLDEKEPSDEIVAKWFLLAQPMASVGIQTQELHLKCRVARQLRSIKLTSGK